MIEAIHLEGVSKTLGYREILKGISFDVHTGDIFGYLGPNGAGKTTTIRILLGLLRADAGTIRITGQDINTTETRLKIGFSLDPDGLYDTMTAVENLDYYAQIYGVKEPAPQIEKALSLVGLAERANDRAGTFSRGMRQRLSLARAMVHNPEVLILDEPTAGVDPSGQIEIRQILLNIARQGNKTVMLSSHNLDEVQRICNRIALIDRGEIKLYGELDSLRRKMGRSGVVIEVSSEIPEGILVELKNKPQFGFRELSGKRLIFEPGAGTTGVGDIVNFLVTHGVNIEKAGKSEASLEEIYAAILKEVEQQ